MVTASLAQLMIPLLTRLGLIPLDDVVATHAIVRTLQPLAVYSSLTFTSIPTTHGMHLISQQPCTDAWLLRSLSRIRFSCIIVIQPARMRLSLNSAAAVTRALPSATVPTI
jgi:hypothetical protein